MSSALASEPARSPAVSRAAELSRGVTFSAVSHRYQTDGGPVDALARIDLEIPRGQFVAILGPSGSGKSTLLRIGSGLLEPTAGFVRLSGGSVSEARRERWLGWLAQDDGLLPWRRVIDNVGLPLRLAQRPWPAAALAMLERVGLADVGQRYPHELSGGMRQRAALARALVADPRIVLLDEPFAHLDEVTRERLGDLLLRLRAPDPPTTLLVTHSVAEAVRLADRIVMVSDRPGRIVRDVEVDVPRPRSELQPAFGRLVHELKSLL